MGQRPLTCALLLLTNFRDLGALSLLGVFFADHLSLNPFDVRIPRGLFPCQSALNRFRLSHGLGLLLAFPC